MDIDFLQKLLSLLVKLQRAVTNKDDKEMNIICQQIEQHIGPFEQFADTLRQCQSFSQLSIPDNKQKLIHWHNYQAAEVINWAADALHYYGKPYPALWYYGFAKEEFISELRLWIEKAKLIEVIDEQTGTRTTRKLTDRQNLAFRLVVGRGLNHRQAAELMGISRVAVTRLMGRIFSNA